MSLEACANFYEGIMLVHLFQSQASLLRGTRGTATVEYLIAVLPLIVGFMLVFQAMVIRVAQLFVVHAAETSVRAAALVSDDDPERYEGEARWWRVDEQGEVLLPGSYAWRLDAIAGAARATLAPLAMRPGLVSAARNLVGRRYEDALVDGVSDFVHRRRLPRRTLWQAPLGGLKTQVSLLRDAQTGQMRVKVHLTADLSCYMPFASRVLCQPRLRVPPCLPRGAHRDAEGVQLQQCDLLGTPSLKPVYRLESEAWATVHGASYRYAGEV